MNANDKIIKNLSKYILDFSKNKIYNIYIDTIIYKNNELMLKQLIKLSIQYKDGYYIIYDFIYHNIAASNSFNKAITKIQKMIYLSEFKKVEF